MTTKNKTTTRAHVCALALALALGACASSDAADAQGDRYGAGVTLTEVTPIEDILAQPETYVGQTVLVEGVVAEVCERKGCWMDIVADGVEIQVKVEDDVIVFPASARGRTALVQGRVDGRLLSPAESFGAAAHRAEEQGLPFDSSATYPETTVYRILGTGAVIRG